MFDQASRLKNVSLAQYAAPLCGELAGRHFHLRFDDGLEIYLQVQDERFFLMGEPGCPLTLEKGCCLKSDEHTYLIHIDRSSPVFAPITLVLDLEGQLVTRVDSGKGSPDILHWFTAKPCFGYIDQPGRPAPVCRNEISRDLEGSKIEWHYNEFDPITHIYLPGGLLRLGHPPFEEMAPPRQQLHLQKVAKGLDLFEEPVLFIKIKADKYLACFIECNMAHVDPMEGGGGILLMDLAKMTDLGVFHTFDENNRETYFPVAAYGRFVYQELPEEQEKSRYPVRFGADGRQVFPPI
jgi:hypothetical protein